MLISCVRKETTCEKMGIIARERDHAQLEILTRLEYSKSGSDYDLMCIR